MNKIACWYVGLHLLIVNFYTALYGGLVEPLSPLSVSIHNFF